MTCCKRGACGAVISCDPSIEAEALGIVDPTRGARSYGSRRAPSRYRLTWLGTPDGLTATHEWRSIKSADEARWRLERPRRLKRERAIKAAARADARRQARPRIEGRMKEFPSAISCISQRQFWNLLVTKPELGLRANLNKFGRSLQVTYGGTAFLYLPCTGGLNHRSCERPRALASLDGASRRATLFRWACECTDKRCPSENTVSAPPVERTKFQSLRLRLWLRRRTGGANG